MFDNVPDWLTERVKGLRDTVDPAERGQVYYEASGRSRTTCAKTSGLKTQRRFSTLPAECPPMSMTAFGMRMLIA